MTFGDENKHTHDLVDNSMEEILNDEQFSKYKVLSREENH